MLCKEAMREKIGGYDDAGTVARKDPNDDSKSKAQKTYASCFKLGKEGNKGKYVMVEKQTDVGGPSALTSNVPSIPDSLHRKKLEQVENSLQNVKTTNRFQALEVDIEIQDDVGAEANANDDDPVPETQLEKISPVVDSFDNNLNDDVIPSMEISRKEHVREDSPKSENSDAQNSCTSSNVGLPNKKGGKYAKMQLTTQRKSSRIENKEGKLAEGQAKSQD